MKRTFNLFGDFGQRESHDFTVSNSQSVAFDSSWDFRVPAAGIIRENWPTIYNAFMAYSYPCYTHEEIWFLDERLGLIQDPTSGREFTFTVTQSGPRFLHEIFPAGHFRCLAKS